MALTGIRLVTAAAAFAAMTGAAQAGIGIAFTTDNGRNLSDAQAEQVLDGMFEAYANNNVSGSGNRCSSAFVRALQAIPGVNRVACIIADGAAITHSGNTGAYTMTLRGARNNARGGIFAPDGREIDYHGRKGSGSPTWYRNPF